MELLCCALSDVGSVRTNNEDAVLVDADHALAVLADGMGGYNAGEVASAMAVEQIANELRQWLDAAGPDVTMAGLRRATERSVELANHAIFEAANTRADCAGMGTTVVVAVACNGQLLVGHVGDSRAYQWQRGRLKQLTRDHSLLQEQLDAGLITEQEAEQSGYRSLVTRALGVEDTVLLDTGQFELKPGQTVLLCSDGLTEMVPDEDIAAVLRSGATLDEQAQQLIDRANANGGRDNVSVVLMHWHESTKMSEIARKLWKR